MTEIFAGLCAVKWSNYVVDGVVALFLLGYVIVCARRGFVSCLFGFVSTLLSLVVAITLAKLVLNVTGGLFGLQGSLETSLTASFSKKEGFDTVIPQSGVESALAQQNFSTTIASLVLKWFGDGALAGTTLGAALGTVVAKLICLLIVGVVLFILCKLLLHLVNKLLQKLADRLCVLGAVNTILGAVIGLIQGTLIVSGVLAVLTLIPSQGIANFLSESLVVGFLYDHNPLVWFIGLFL